MSLLDYLFRPEVRDKTGELDESKAYALPTNVPITGWTASTYTFGPPNNGEQWLIVAACIDNDTVAVKGRYSVNTGGKAFIGPTVTAAAATDEVDVLQNVNFPFVLNPGETFTVGDSAHVAGHTHNIYLRFYLIR